MKKICLLLMSALMAPVLCYSQGDFEQAFTKKLIEDETKKFEFLKRHGDKEGMCASAIIIKIQYTELRDDENYKKWRMIEERVCSEAF